MAEITANEVVAEYTEPTEEMEELQRKIELLEQARINLRVSPHIFDKLNRQAEFLGKTVEDHCVEVLVSSLSVSIGKATISGATAIGPKIVGPSGNPVRRG